MAMTHISSGGVNPLATRQLAAWEEIADGWATCQVFDANEGVWIESCRRCMGGLYRVTDRHGKPYRWTGDQRRTLIVAHLRLSHLDLDPNP